MTDLWTVLVPLALVTAVLPIQLAITLLMLRSSGGLVRAAAWVAGMSVVRILQFLVFGVVLERAMNGAEAGPSAVEGAFLLIVAVFLFVTAARKLLAQPDEDAPPPRWMTMLDGLSVGRAFSMGAGLVALSPKLWAFTLGAIGAIEEARLDTTAAWLVFIVWVVAAQGLHLGAVAAAVIAPARAEALFARAGDALERHGRLLMVAIGVVFGTWFLLKALAAFTA